MSQESVEAAYRRKLASNPDGEMDFITLEIYHPLLSKRWLLVRGADDLTATLETGEVVTFEGTPMEAKAAANNNDMDQTASFSLPDVLNILDEEMDRIPYDNKELPKFIFRRYVSTDLSYPCDGPVVYELQTLTQEKGVFTAETGTPMLNQRATGILMTPEEIPLLRGILTS
ncbi:TPA: DUF1833 family protein [Salmonella enterica subsp. enterica serovar Dublin]|nr:DUF1833 domain-containing protein [Salmonella enterica]HCC8877149.1 DUF1833 family protein [Salmonella enterica subsp. enterica serovar Dublin]HCC9126637.1 DUF1833 family protein [Salmonella enterica subsp. enterica serovar Dublin]HCC9316209.1 DUF1833 family protein [Salmonella enterica subsp. enterica serovar Dublin]HCC9823729.1 DUF1833 family protein [Salmonella enterica subsp. enterica serovar Dublin]